MKTLIIGATGQLGSDLLKVLPPGPDVVALGHRDVEIADRQSIDTLFEAHRPQFVYNLAAFHQVDVCEDQSERAFAVNAHGVRLLARACREHGAALLHISTDYVYGGDSRRSTPFGESDAPHPINAYGISKLAGEYFIRYELERHFIVRSGSLFGVAGSSGKGGNFVELMIRLATEGKRIRVVDDQRMTPTYTLDLARQIVALAGTTDYGLYHASGQGECTWHDFAGEIFRQCGLQPDFGTAKTGDFGEKARRPPYSVLDNARLRAIGLDRMRPWQEALSDYLEERRNRPSRS